MKAGEGAEKWCLWVARLDGMGVGLHLRVSELGGGVWWLKDAGKGYFGGGWCHFWACMAGTVWS